MLTEKIKQDIQLASQGQRWPKGKKPQYREIFDDLGIMIELFPGGMIDYPRPAGHIPKYVSVYYEGQLVYFDLTKDGKPVVLLSLLSD